MKRSLLAGFTILVAWMLLDLLIHRIFLAPIYEATKNLWRPFDQMNVVLIYTATLVLIGVFIGIYTWLVRPKSLAAGLGLLGSVPHHTHFRGVMAAAGTMLQHLDIFDRTP